MFGRVFAGEQRPPLQRHLAETLRRKTIANRSGRSDRLRRRIELDTRMRLSVHLLLAVAVVFASLAIPSAGRAEPGLLTTDSLLQGCEAFVEDAPTANQMQIGACAGGVNTALEIGRAARRVCPPADIGAVAAARVVTDFMQDHAERRSRPFGTLALEALGQRWPCR
jgi:hypothetical protein